MANSKVSLIYKCIKRTGKLKLMGRLGNEEQMEVGKALINSFHSGD